MPGLLGRKDLSGRLDLPEPPRQCQDRKGPLVRLALKGLHQ